MKKIIAIIDAQMIRIENYLKNKIELSKEEKLNFFNTKFTKLCNLYGISENDYLKHSI